MVKALVLGITGQDGSYLAELLLSKGYEVHGLIRRNSAYEVNNIEHLKDRLSLHYGDILGDNDLLHLIYDLKPDEMYNLAGQSDVALSFKCPQYTKDVNGKAVGQMLENLKRYSPGTRFYQASTSELFGNNPAPQNEQTPLDPQSPYAIGKAEAYREVIRARKEGLFACNGILFNHECLTAQTPVFVKNKGELIQICAIEELVPHRENPDHGTKYTTPVKDYALQVWDDGKWTWVKTLTATWNLAHHDEKDKSVRSVNFRGGYYEVTAYHHSFLEDKTEKVTYMLTRGEKLYLSKFPGLSELTYVSDYEAELLGMLVADGYIHDGKGRFIKTDNNLRDRIKELWLKVAGGYTSDALHPSGYTSNSIPSVELYGASNYLRMIEPEIYNEKRFKQIPTRIINANIHAIISFLKGYNFCDGLKGGKQTSEFKCFTTNSQVLAAGLWYLVEQALGLRITSHPEFRNGLTYYHLNINSDTKSNSGKHLIRPLNEIKSNEYLEYTGWLFDFETQSGTFSTGIGHGWVHNSPRRGLNFVTRKVTHAVAEIVNKDMDSLHMGNLDSKRDWGYSPDYVYAMWLMLQRDTPDDFVIGTGESHTIRELLFEAFSQVGLDWQNYVVVDPQYIRPSEVFNLRADASKANKVLNWHPTVTFKQLINIMLQHDLEESRSLVTNK
jgi:GDPmannose 4,6-dehydratase